MLLTGPAALAGAETDALFAPLSGDRHVLIAVSGGPDSMALLALLARWRADGRAGPRLGAATVDHGLRPESAAEAAMVAAHCARLDIPHATLCWRDEKPASGLQAAARRARYDLLCAHAAGIGADCLVTAHTLDDQAETVLMRLASGSGPAGLAGMRASVPRGGLIHRRPLLSVPKARLVATCAALGLAVVEDPANGQRRFARGRWRELMPALAREGLSAERLARLARRAARLDRLVEEGADQVLALASSAGQTRFDARIILAAPEDIALRVLTRIIAAGRAGLDEAFPRLERLENLHAELVLALGEGRRLRRSLAGLVLTLDRQGMLTLAAETIRRRGRSPQI